MRAAAAATLAALLFLLAACTKPLANVELSLMIWGAPDEVATVNQYVREFHERNPDVKVKIQHAPDMGFRQKLNARFLGDDPPDVFYLNYEDFPGVASRGWLLPLDEIVADEKKKGAFDPDAYFKNVFDQFKYEGRLYGVVKDFATLVVYYNKDLFDKHSVPYPKAGWTWADFLDAARRLTHPESREYGVVLETWPGEWFPWIWTAGGQIALDEPPRWVLGEEPWLTKNAVGFQFMADLIWEEHVAPSPSVTRDQGTSDLFRTGKAAMCTYGRWMCMQFRHIKDFDWDVVEMPMKERKATTLFPVCYAIARETKQKGAAWELVKFLTGRDAQVSVAESGQAIPSMRAVAFSEHFRSPAVLADQQVSWEPNVASVEFADPGPRLLTWNECRERVNRGLEGLWNGSRRNARELLAELQPVLAEIVSHEESLRRQARELQRNGKK